MDWRKGEWSEVAPWCRQLVPWVSEGKIDVTYYYHKGREGTMWMIPYKDAALISTPECQITFGAVAIGFTEIRVIRVSIAKQVVI